VCKKIRGAVQECKKGKRSDKRRGKFTSGGRPAGSVYGKGNAKERLQSGSAKTTTRPVSKREGQGKGSSAAGN